MHFIVDCIWGSIGPWSKCSTTCGMGNKTAYRTILRHASHGGRECDGPSNITRDCENVPCPGRRKSTTFSINYACNKIFYNTTYTHLMKSLLLLELTTTTLTTPLKVRVDSNVMPRASTNHTDANQGSGLETLEPSLKPRTVFSPLIETEGKIHMPEVKKSSHEFQYLLHPNIRKYTANGIG